MEFEGAIREQAKAPTTIVDFVVVVRTQRNEVGEIGGPAVLPFVDVVDLAPVE